VSEVLVPGMVVERYGPTLVHAEVGGTPASKLYSIYIVFFSSVFIVGYPPPLVKVVWQHLIDSYSCLSF
jgi:hypothetical protein